MPGAGGGVRVGLDPRQVPDLPPARPPLNRADANRVDGRVPCGRSRSDPVLARLEHPRDAEHNDVMSVVRKHRLRMPSDLALLLKTVMMCEGVAEKLDPGFE